MNLMHVGGVTDWEKLKRYAEASMGPARCFMHKQDYLDFGTWLLGVVDGPLVRFDVGPRGFIYANATFVIVPDWEQGTAVLAHYGE